jgi:hypothetical protein
LRAMKIYTVWPFMRLRPSPFEHPKLLLFCAFLGDLHKSPYHPDPKLSIVSKPVNDTRRRLRHEPDWFFRFNRMETFVSSLDIDT